MQTLFIPESVEQENLAQIVKTHTNKKERQKALNKLRVLTGRNESISTLQAKEYYEQIPNKPRGFTRFRMATIICFPKNSNIGYNYK